MSTTSDAGFSLLELLVVIALTALLLTAVMISPLNHLGRKNSANEVSKAFSNWMHQQVRSSTWSTAPLRMCLIDHQVKIQFYQDHRWQQGSAWFTIPTDMAIEARLASSSAEEESPCFNFTPVGISPAGSFTFGHSSSSTVSWGNDE